MSLDRGEDLALELAHLRADGRARAALAVGLDLGGRRRLEVLAEALDLRARQRQVHDALRDPAHLLGRHVARLPERAGGDREPVEDVGVVVAGHLVDLADLAAVGGDDLPAGPDQEPGDGVGHRGLTLRDRRRDPSPDPRR